MEVTCRFSKEKLRKINKLKDEKDTAFIQRSLKLKYRYQLIVRLETINYKEDFFLLFIFLLLSLNQPSSFLYLYYFKTQSFLITYKYFIILYAFFVLRILQRVMYNQAHYYIGHLIRSFVRILFADALFARLCSGYTLDLFLLGFITKPTAYE